MDFDRFTVVLLVTGLATPARRSMVATPSRTSTSPIWPSCGRTAISSRPAPVRCPSGPRCGA